MDTTPRGLSAPSPERLRRAIEETRADLGATLGALQRRGRELTDVRRILRVHPIAVMTAVAAVLTGIAIVVALRERRRRRWGYGPAFRRERQHPERLGRAEPGILRQAARAALAALASSGARRIMVDSARARPA
jgi:hypothetical protein